MKTMTDEQIAELVQHGDIDSFGELVSRYEEKLTRYARRFLARREDVEDLVQDAFVKAYEHIQSFDTSLRFSPWIYRIAHNTFINEIKRKSRYSSVFEADTILPLMPARETADEAVLSAELQAEMELVLDTLSPKYREVLVLHYYEELSYKEISDVLKIPVTTVGVRMTRARTKIKELLDTTRLHD